MAGPGAVAGLPGLLATGVSLSGELNTELSRSCAAKVSIERRLLAALPGGRAASLPSVCMSEVAGVACRVNWQLCASGASPNL